MQCDTVHERAVQHAEIDVLHPQPVTRGVHDTQTDAPHGVWLLRHGEGPGAHGIADGRLLYVATCVPGNVNGDMQQCQP